jgi:hypothetical protein
MPTINDRPLPQSARPGCDPWRAAVVRSAAIAIAMSLGIAACAPIKNSAPQAGAGASPPIKVEPLPGPISLAPRITGAPASSAAPSHRPASPPTPATAVAAPASQSVPAAAVATPAAPPKRTPAAAPTPKSAPTVATPTPIDSPADVGPIPTGQLPSCPPGTIAMWSEPDVIGTRVGICHALQPPR